MISKEQIKSVIESLLFLSDEPLTIEKLREIFETEGSDTIREALMELESDLMKPDRGITLNEVAGGYQFRTKPENASFIFRLNKVKPAKLSRAALETLSIIAYRQPITKQEVEAIRGVDCGWTIKSLLEKNLVKIIGKKDEPGNPLIYATTKEFLEFFNLKSLSDLPSLREYHELNEKTDSSSIEPEFKFSKDQ